MLLLRPSFLQFPRRDTPILREFARGDSIQAIQSLQRVALRQALPFRHVFPFDIIRGDAMFAMEAGPSVPDLPELFGIIA